MFGFKRRKQAHKQALEDSIRAQFPKIARPQPHLPKSDTAPTIDAEKWFPQMAVLPASRRRIWVIGGIYGRLQPLQDLHDRLLSRLGRQDAVVYAGNMIGNGPDSAAVIDEVLLARRRLLALPGMIARDVQWLRGGQEEMWRKLQELQYVAQPEQAWQWLSKNGTAAVVESYGGDLAEASEAIRGGTRELNRWCASMRQTVDNRHNAFYAQMRHAATCRQKPGDPGGLLICATGLDPTRPVQKMGDHFWWNHKGFGQVTEPWQGFDSIIRGNIPDSNSHIPVNDKAWSYTLSAGINAPLQAACFTDDGGIDEILAAPITNNAAHQHRVA